MRGKRERGNKKRDRKGDEEEKMNGRNRVNGKDWEAKISDRERKETR